MKKLIIVALALVLSLPSFAQLNVKKSVVGKPVEECVISMQWAWIYLHNNSHWLVLKSSNQFDDWYWIRLGTTKAQCVETANQLKELAETITDTDVYYIDNGQGEQFRVTQYKALGIDGLWFAADGRAGGGNIQMPYIKKVCRWCEALTDK